MWHPCQQCNGVVFYRLILFILEIVLILVGVVCQSVPNRHGNSPDLEGLQEPLLDQPVRRPAHSSQVQVCPHNQTIVVL